MRLYYYRSSPMNFGDALSPIIVNTLNKSHVKTVNIGEPIFSNRHEHFVFGLGSIFHFVQNGDVIWGSGVNPNRKNPTRLKSLTIHAVRGPLTRDFIQKNYEMDCPEIFGDPALLLPKLFPDKQHNPVRKVGIIPHLEDTQFIDSINEKIFSVHQPWEKVVDFILSSELIISSALHAIIVAEAFGVPARWLRNSTLPSYYSEPEFKFNDYYASTYRSLNDWAETINEAIRIGGKEPIPASFNTEKLENSFPTKEFSALSSILSSAANLVDKEMTIFNRLLRKF